MRPSFPRRIFHETDRSTEVRMLIGVERCVYSRQAKVSSYGFPNETSNAPLMIL